MTTQIQTIQFNNQSLITFEQNGTHYTAMKPICENIGLDWAAQYSRIKRDEILNSTIVMITMVANDGKERQILCLPIEYLNGWLFGIDVKRVKPEIRETLIRYKKECYQALHDYWNKGVAINERAVRAEKLSKEHQTIIKELVLGRVKNLPKAQQAPTIIKQWAALKTHFGKSYKDINDDQFTEAVSLIARLPLEGELIIDTQENKFNITETDYIEIINGFYAITRFHESVYFLMKKLKGFSSHEQDRVDFNYEVSEAHIRKMAPIINTLIQQRNSSMGLPI